MHIYSGAVYKRGFFLGNLSNPDTSIKIRMNTACGLLFWKKTSADQNGRHFSRWLSFGVSKYTFLNKTPNNCYI